MLTKKNIEYIYIITITITIGLTILFTNSNDISAQDQDIISTSIGPTQNKNDTTIMNKFNPVPFNEIPLVVINSTYGQYKFGADFSLDFGDETVIEQDTSATSVPNMRLDKDDATLSLQLQCDSNDICDTSLAPESVSIYLVDDAIQDRQIAENSFPILELGYNDCGILSIEECANFPFSIPNNIILGNYKIVVKMSFDDTEWIFINPIEIVDYNIK